MLPRPPLFHALTHPPVLSLCSLCPGSTHWGQQTFYVDPPITATTTDSLKSSIEVTRREDNPRLLHVKLDVTVEGEDGAKKTSKLQFNID